MIDPGEVAVAADFIYDSERDATPANDEGRVPKLEANGRLSLRFTHPAGYEFMWPHATPPAGTLIRNGQAVSRTTYAELFAVYGTTYGAGDGSTTFNLPDDRGKLAMGYDNTQTEFDTIGETGGSKSQTVNTGGPSGDGHFANLGDENEPFNGDTHTHSVTVNVLNPYRVKLPVVVY